MKTINIIILIIYSILFIFSFILISYLRYKKISKLTNSKKYFVINKMRFTRIFFGIINLALLIGAVGICVEEKNTLYLSIDILLIYLVNLLLFFLIQFYTAIELLVYSNDKIYLYYKGKTVEFDYLRVHFQKKSNSYLMYYENDLVFNTHMRLSINALKRHLKK